MLLPEKEKDKLRYNTIFKSNLNEPDFFITETLFKNLTILKNIKIGQKLYVNQDLISTEHSIIKNINNKLNKQQTEKQTEQTEKHSEQTEKQTEQTEKQSEQIEQQSEQTDEKSFKFDSIIRYIFNESRSSTLKKIKSIIQDIIINGYLAIESHESSYSFSRIRYNTIDDLSNLLYIKRWEIVRSAIIAKDNKETLELIINEFKELISGLNSIKETYKDDSEFNSSISMEIEIVQNSIKEFEDYLYIMNMSV
jgi:hypothetical protein